MRNRKCCANTSTKLELVKKSDRERNKLQKLLRHKKYCRNSLQVQNYSGRNSRALSVLRYCCLRNWNLRIRMSCVVGWNCHHGKWTKAHIVGWQHVCLSGKAGLLLDGQWRHLRFLMSRFQFMQDANIANIWPKHIKTTKSVLLVMVPVKFFKT